MRVGRGTAGLVGQRRPCAASAGRGRLQQAHPESNSRELAAAGTVHGHSGIALAATGGRPCTSPIPGAAHRRAARSRQCVGHAIACQRHGAASAGARWASEASAASRRCRQQVAARQHWPGRDGGARHAGAQAGRAGQWRARRRDVHRGLHTRQAGRWKPQADSAGQSADRQLRRRTARWRCAPAPRDRRAPRAGTEVTAETVNARLLLLTCRYRDSRGTC